MAATLKVPTIFEAIDRMTAPLRKMGESVDRFAGRAQRAVARGNRWFRKLTPTISGVQQQLLSMVGTAAVVSAIFAGITFSSQSLIDYEKKVASFRTIVSDLSNKEFVKYRQEIGRVAKASKGLASTVDVASSFEKIAGLNADFAKTAQGLGLVSSAAITLSKASGDDLGVSAENLVGIMNQFNLAANQANRVINVLAAGQAVGAASITQASESYKNFGSVAKGSNITLEQSIALIQTLGKYSIFGAEAGTALRGSTLRLQKAGLGFKSGQFQIMDALAETKKKFDSLSSAKKKARYLIKVFGAENITAGRILMTNIPVIQDFTKGVTGTSEAQKAAAINSGTLADSIEQLKNSWTTYITTNDSANEGLEKVKKTSKFLKDHLDEIVDIGAKVLTFFAAWKAILWLTQIAITSYNVVLGIMGGLTGVVNVSVGKSTIGLAAYNATVWAATAATTAFNAAFVANPIVAIVIAIGSVLVAIYNWRDVLLKFRVFWILLVAELSKAWRAFTGLFTGFSFKSVFMTIGKAVTDFLLAPLRMVMGLVALLPGAIGRNAASGLAMLNRLTQGLTVDINSNRPSGQATPALPSPLVYAQRQTTQSQKDFNGKLAIDINDPGNFLKKVTPSGSLKPDSVITSTQGAR